MYVEVEREKVITEVFDQFPSGWLAERSCACVFSCLTGCLDDGLHDVDVADLEGRGFRRQVHHKGCRVLATSLHVLRLTGGREKVWVGDREEGEERRQ
jgi:hypothetical protein